MHSVKKLYISITPFFPTKDSFRGPYVYDQVKAIEKNSDYEVIVFKPKRPWTRTMTYDYEGIKVYYFDSIEMPSYILNGLTNDINSYLFIKRVKELGIQINDIAVAHGHTSQFAAYALALKNLNPKIKAIVQHHDCDPFTIRNGKWAKKKWNAIFRANKSIELFEKVDLHVCVSEGMKDSLLSFPNAPQHLYYDDYRNALSAVKGVRKPKIKDVYVLYNGVDCDKFKPLEKTLDLEGRVNIKPYTIGCIANFVELKDQITLLKALKILVDNGIHDIKIIFVGSGPTLSNCKQYIVNNNLTQYVDILSEFEHSRLRGYYQSLDLFVLPTYFEGFGCVCTEAAACGVPFMICKYQGVAEYIGKDDEDLWTFEPHDYKTLARLIANAKSQNLKQTLIQPYDINTLVAGYLKYIS